MTTFPPYTKQKHMITGLSSAAAETTQRADLLIRFYDVCCKSPFTTTPFKMFPACRLGRAGEEEHSR